MQSLRRGALIQQQLGSILSGIGLSLLATLILCPLAKASELDLKTITQKAIATSFPLQVAKLDQAISQTDIKAARSDYFPNIRSNLNLEYLKDLEDQPRPVTTIGTSVLPSGTRYQNSIGVSVNQNLLDFGVRQRKVRMARLDTLAKAFIYDQALRDLKLKLIELYTNALLSQKTIRANEAILDLSTQAYQLKKRFYDAGEGSKVDVSEEAIQVAQAMDDIQTNKRDLQKHLDELSFYTQELYVIEETELADLELVQASDSVSFAVENAPDVMAYALEISKKQKEVEILKRQNLPQVSLYSYYNLYGFDPEQLGGAIKSLSQRTISLGLSISAPVFDGFKNQAAVERAKLELAKLKVQKQEKIAQLRYQAKLFSQEAEGLTVQLKTKATIVNKTQDKLTLVKRLSEKQMIDPMPVIKEHIDRIRKQLEAERAMIQSIAAQQKLAVLSTG